MSLLIGLRKQAAIVASVAAWICLVGFGMNMLLRYTYTPGHAATPPAIWSARAPVKISKERATLVMFAHPNCPCSRASIGELAILMARAQGKLDAYVFFHRPANESSAWVRTDLWRSATSIPGVRVMEDTGGDFAKQVGAYTSGQTLFYDVGGRLVFNGGITHSRGHSGDNAGREVITSFLEGRRPNQNITPVFGCSLREQ